MGGLREWWHLLTLTWAGEALSSFRVPELGLGGGYTLCSREPQEWTSGGVKLGAFLWSPSPLHLTPGLAVPQAVDPHAGQLLPFRKENKWPFQAPRSTLGLQSVGLSKEELLNLPDAYTSLPNVLSFVLPPGEIVQNSPESFGAQCGSLYLYPVVVLSATRCSVGCWREP